MAFPNIQRILRMGSAWSALKLILIVGASSRPKYKAIFLALLWPFIRKGEVHIRYRCYERYNRSTLRISDLDADCLSTRELAVRDIYGLETDFQPDAVIDGGGNIGLFTLRVAASIPTGVKSTPRFVVCEPLPRNISQIKKHLDMNGVRAEILACCLGGERRTISFYCRSANESSFDPALPYDSILDIPVLTLQDAMGAIPEGRILIKLDIEGMEVETLQAYLPTEQRAVYIVGELHDFPNNAPKMECIFRDHGWTLELFDVDQKTSSFRACSPSAVPLLHWAKKNPNPRA